MATQLLNHLRDGVPQILVHNPVNVIYVVRGPNRERGDRTGTPFLELGVDGLQYLSRYVVCGKRGAERVEGLAGPGSRDPPNANPKPGHTHCYEDDESKDCIHPGRHLSLLRRTGRTEQRLFN